MLAIRVRVRPCSERLLRSSSGRFTSSAPSSARSIVIGAATVCESVPLGPLTVTVLDSTVTSTPDGTTTGTLPIRDIACLLLVLVSPDVGEDFPTHALRVRLTVGKQPLAGRDDRDAEAAEHLGQAGALGVDTEAGLADPADAGDGALTVAAVLERDDEGLAHGGAALGVDVVHDLPGGDVALLLEDLGDAGLKLAVRHVHGVVVRLVGIAQTRQHVCDRVGHGHGLIGPFSLWFPARDGPAAFDGERWGLPGALGHAGQLAAVCHLPQADPAQAELAVDRLGTAAALAARVATDLELRLLRSLYLETSLCHVSSPY